MIFLIAVGALVFGAGTAWVASDDVRYLTRAGLEETRILASARPIEELVADPATPESFRGSLRLVVAAREFAAAAGLDAGETYTTFTDVKRDTLLLVLQAAPRDCLCAYTWKWPIVGAMPYKGFFDAADAREAADRLASKGYDVHLRPAGAFSTLGWFNDPLLSTALTPDSLELVATVFHEIAHNSLYVRSATPFNESFAQMVGYHAAEAFFRARGDSVTARRAADRLHDEMVFGRFYAELTARLDSLYALGLDSAAVDSGRAEAGRWVKERLEGPVAAELRTYTISRVPDRPINNARLIGSMIYRTKLELFDAWYQRHGGDVGRSAAALKELVEGAAGDEAFDRLEAALGLPPG
jgi:predicted aminopeptidase